MELKGWIARDMSGDLYFYSDMPERNVNVFFASRGRVINLGTAMFPEVTWESSPVEVVFKIEKV